MKKWFAVLVVVVMVTTLFAGCKQEGGGTSTDAPKTTGSESGETEGKTEGEPSGKTTVIKIAIWGDENRAKTYYEMLEPFCEENQCTVEIELNPLSEHYDKLSARLGANTAPDIFWIADAREGTYISSGWCANLRDTLETYPDWDIDDFMGGMLESTDYPGDGGIYGVPLSYGVRAIYYNKTLFEQAGIKTPAECVADGTWTYETMFDLGAQIEAWDSSKIGSKLWAVGQVTNGVQNFADILCAYGANIVNDDSTEFILDSEQGIKVTQMVYDAMFKNSAHAMPGDDTAFISGNIAMSRETYSYLKTVVNANVDFEWDIVPLPYGDAGADGGLYTGVAYWCANSHGQNLELAKKMIAFLTTPENQLKVCATFMVPRRSVMESDTILNPGEGYPSSENIRLCFMDSVEERGLMRYTGTSEWTLFCTTVQQYYEMIWAGVYSVEDGIAAMKAECEQYLNK